MSDDDIRRRVSRAQVDGERLAAWRDRPWSLPPGTHKGSWSNQVWSMEAQLVSSGMSPEVAVEKVMALEAQGIYPNQTKPAAPRPEPPRVGPGERLHHPGDERCSVAVQGGRVTVRWQEVFPGGVSLVVDHLPSARSTALVWEEVELPVRVTRWGDGVAVDWLDPGAAQTEIGQRTAAAPSVSGAAGSIAAAALLAGASVLYSRWRRGKGKDLPAPESDTNEATDSSTTEVNEDGDRFTEQRGELKP